MRKKSTRSSTGNKTDTEKVTAAHDQGGSSSRAPSPSPPLSHASGVDAVPLRMLVPGLSPDFELPPDTPVEESLQGEPEKTHSSPVEIDSDSSEETVEKGSTTKKKESSAATTLKSRLRRPTKEATTPQVEKKGKSHAQKKNPEPKVKTVEVVPKNKGTDKGDKVDDQVTAKVTRKRKGKQVQFDEPQSKKATPADKEKKTPPKSSTTKEAGAPDSTQKPKESAPSSRRKFSAKEKGKAKAVEDEFVEELAEEESNRSSREIWIERGFKDALPDLPGFVAIPINTFEWEFFCSVQIPANVQWVREFYENLEDIGEGRGAISNVRGKVIKVTAARINEYYLISSKDEDHYQTMLEDPQSDEYDIALDVVAKEGTSWGIKLASRFLKATQLNSQAGIWLHFIKNRLLPTTHDNEVSAARVAMLYCILCSKPFNVGRIILEELLRGAAKKSGKLCFPSLITGLCEKEGLSAAPTDEIREDKSKSIIDINILLPRLAGSRTKNATSTAAASSSASAHAELAIVKSELAALRKQFSTFLVYAFKQATLDNASRPDRLVVPFPEDLLIPATAADSDE